MIVFRSSYRVHFVFHLRKDIGIDIWINNGKFTLHIIITVEQTANLENKREQNENVNYPTKKNSLIRNAMSTIIFQDRTIIFLILLWNMTVINCIFLRLICMNILRKNIILYVYQAVLKYFCCEESNLWERKPKMSHH